MQLICRYVMSLSVEHAIGGDIGQRDVDVTDGRFFHFRMGARKLFLLLLLLRAGVKKKRRSVKPCLFRRAALEQTAQIGFRDGRRGLDGAGVGLPAAGSVARVAQPNGHVEETVAGIHLQLLGVVERHHLLIQNQKEFSQNCGKNESRRII